MSWEQFGIDIDGENIKIIVAGVSLSDNWEIVAIGASFNDDDGK